MAELLRRKKTSSGVLWPTRYADLTGDCAFRFLTERWYTLNEADQTVGRIPAKDYVEWLCHLWVDSFAAREPLVLEKSRRLVVSWCARGLETWAMGISRGEWLIVDQTHENSAEHLWRIHFALEQMRDRHPEMKLLPHDARGAVLVKSPTHVILPNGSIFTQAHQDAGATQGKGKTGITLEELSKYRGASAFWAQAKIVTMGQAGKGGGWINGICNSSPNPDWHKIKGADEKGVGGASARKLIGLDQ